MAEDSSPRKKRLKVNFNDGNTVTSDLWSTKEFTDVVFIVGTERFPAHKLVLATRSEYFRGLLYGGMKEATQSYTSDITLPEDIITPEAFRRVLQYAYTGSLDLEEPMDDIFDIICAANYLRFDSLKSTIVKHTFENSCIENVLPLYVLNDRSNLQLSEVEEKCISFIDGHAPTLLKSPSFLELPQEYVVRIISRTTFVAPEKDILKAVMKWKGSNKKSVEEMSVVAKCIRLSRFSTQDIFTVVEPTGFYSKVQLLDGIRILMKPILSETEPRGQIGAGDILDAATFNPNRDLNIGSRIVTEHRRRYSKNIEGTITLAACHLVNCLCFEAYPTLGHLKWYSYTVSVSLNGSSWFELFKYSCFHCRGSQALHFPTISLRYVKICIDSKEDENGFPIHVSKLVYLEKPIPFKFLSKGVIAPLYDHKVDFIALKKRKDGAFIAGAYFKQPYSASTLTIEYTHGGAVAGIKVILGKYKRGINNEITPSDVKSPINIKMSEMEVGYVELVISDEVLTKCNPSAQGTASPEHVQPMITSITCRSSATVDIVDMKDFIPYLTAN